MALYAGICLVDEQEVVVAAHGMPSHACPTGCSLAARTLDSILPEVQVVADMPTEPR